MTACSAETDMEDAIFMVVAAGAFLGFAVYWVIRK